MATSNPLNLVKVEIKINGKECDFLNMNLTQSISTHHYFEIEVNYKAGKPSVWAVTPDEIFKQLGEEVHIKMTHRQTGEVTDFFGIITDIVAGGYNGDQGFVILKGGSPTLILDRDPSMQCFTETTLQNIVSEVLDNSGVKVEVENNPRFGGTIPYVARYKESSYAFLSRLLTSFGEWFYYDGTKLIVGNPQVSTTTKATYNMELRSVHIASTIRPLNTEVYDYDPSGDEYFNDAPSQLTEGENNYMRVARGRSEGFYPSAGILPTSRAIVNDNDVVTYMASEHSRNYSQMSQFEAVSNTCDVRLGELVVTTVPKTFEGVNITDLGRYRVTEIIHQVDNKEIYTNRFRGVPGATEAMPADPSVQMPVAYPEPATVMDNKDPEGQGRVKVQFFWQYLTDPDATTHWIRVQTPDGGSSDVFNKNRGFFFIPEVGDQVMVGFQQGDPGRPFVMGSLYHSGNTSGITGDNEEKSIKTKSGIRIVLNDNRKSVYIADPSGNTFEMDGEGNIQISAPNNISVKCGETLTVISKNIDVQVAESVNEVIEQDHTIYVGANRTTEVGENCSYAVNGDYNVQAGGDSAYSAAGITVDAASGDLQLQASGLASLQGGSDVQISK